MVALQRLLYGPLRPIEIEQLYEKAWFAITETCLAMTIFRDEVGAWFLVMLVALLIGKVWGWIGDGRVEVLEQQPPANPALFHARLSFSLLLSMFFDIAMLRYAVHTVLQMARPNMMVMFAFEFAVLTVASSSTTARYVISLMEAYVTGKQMQLKIEERRAEIRAEREIQQRGRGEGSDVPAVTEPNDAEIDIDELDIDVPGWEDKGQWIFYLDLVTDFLKLVVYLSFFFILLAFYGLPIHIMRDVFLTLRSFIKRITDFLRYRRATQDMNKRYPDASAAEVMESEVCIICREEMQAWPTPAVATNEAAPANHVAVDDQPTPSRVDERSRPKKLPCGHILHFGCLRSWLERQQICPTCRRPVMTANRTATAGNVNGVGVLPRPGHVAVEGGDHVPVAQAVDAAPQPAPAPPAPARVQQNRGRVINIGPLRFGFGMGQEEVLQDLAHQLQGGQPIPPVARLADGPPGQVPNDGRQHIGFGFGFGPRHPIAPPPNQAQVPPQAQAQTPTQTSIHTQLHPQVQAHAHVQAQMHAQMQAQMQALLQLQAQNQAQPQPAHQNTMVMVPTTTAIQAQLHQLASQINHEIRTIRATGEAFRSVQALVRDLEQLRQPQATQPEDVLSRNPSILSSHNVTSNFAAEVAPGQLHQSPAIQPPLVSGSPNLPANMMIPPGWTLLPLTRLGRDESPHPPASLTPTFINEGNGPSIPTMLWSSTHGVPPHSGGLPDPPLLPTAATTDPVVSPMPTCSQPGQSSYVVGDAEQIRAAVGPNGSVPFRETTPDPSSGSSLRNSTRAELDEKQSQSATEVMSAAASADLSPGSRRDDAGPSKGKAKVVSIEDLEDD